jgi:hypothetical protein
MQTPTHTVFPKLEDINRPTVETASAAFYLNRREQTLRGWACHEDGPLRPIRIIGSFLMNSLNNRFVQHSGGNV